MIIKSLLDNDLYKLTQQQVVYALHHDVNVSYKFINRDPSRKIGFNVFHQVKQAIKNLDKLKLSDDEYDWLLSLGYFNKEYLDYFKRFKFRPDEQIYLSIDSSGSLTLGVHGLWHETILYEVPLMAIISDCFFGSKCDRSMVFRETLEKGHQLNNNRCKFSDFGTRRRRNFDTHETVIMGLYDQPAFIGTSNLHLAKQFSLAPIGTIAHEWIMAYDAFNNHDHDKANLQAHLDWHNFYGYKVFDTALPDTYGTDSFLKHYDLGMHSRFPTIRHDSGDPFKFIDKVSLAKYYRPDITFSDSVNTNLALFLQKATGGNCKFGIGTHFTNDFSDDVKALNIVIKLNSVNGIPVQKLSDSPGKNT